jgi:hypothetical protein
MRKLVVDTADNDIKDKCLSHFSYLFLYVTNYALLIQIAIYKESYISYPFDSLYFGDNRFVTIDVFLNFIAF